MSKRKESLFGDISEFEWVEAPPAVSPHETSNHPENRHVKGPTMPPSSYADVLFCNVDKEPQLKRDDWMNGSFDEFITSNCCNEKRTKKQHLSRQEDEKKMKDILAERELNPFLKREVTTDESFVSFENNSCDDDSKNDGIKDKKLLQSSHCDEDNSEENIECLNTLNASLLRAQLKGDLNAVNKLQAAISKLRKNENKSVDAKSSRRDHLVNYAKRLKSSSEKESKKSSSKPTIGFTRIELENEYEMNFEVLDKTRHLKEWDRISAIAYHRRNNTDCALCLDSANPKTVVEICDGVYVSVPSCSPLVDFQCAIVATEHTSSSLTCESEIWLNCVSVIERLIECFRKKSMSCIFVEHVRHPSKPYAHMNICCYPLPTEKADLAPMYFKKAILDSEGNWAQNRKIIDLKLNDIRRKLPVGLPYFMVSFGLENGFAHVIESDKEYHKDFALDILCGLLNIEQQKGRHYSRRTEHSDMLLSRRDRLREIFHEV